MERVLDFYAEPYDPERPVVCPEETSTQLLADVRPSTASGPGQARGLRVPVDRAADRARNLNLNLTSVARCDILGGRRGRRKAGVFGQSLNCPA